MTGDDAPDLFSIPPDYPSDHRGNPIPPHTCDHFEEIALRMAKRGFTHYSARTIIHVMRHHTAERDGTSAYKINDHISPPLARWFLVRHPELPSFFELRERITDGYQEEQAA
jgi:hypothetical protein